MKKYLSVLLVLCALSIPARAELDDVNYTIRTITTNAGSSAYVVRGVVESVYVTIPSAKTATVSIATASGVNLFTGTALTSATDGHFNVRYPVVGSTGSAITWITAQAAAANAATNIVYDKLGVAELVTVTVTPAANTTETNTYSVALTVNK
jgi:hypothetical protein